MEIKTTKNHLSKRDLEKLTEIQKNVSEGTACTYEKAKCQDYLESVINPKCCVCRKPLEGDIYIVNDHKMHIKCRKKYPG
ncbi:MAG: hypothetical protein JW724_05745 [Candidatus Altiarchaeota archaeon]|nr:hypothetical protein [Candidatus Altiarchaeota archaeon]